MLVFALYALYSKCFFLFFFAELRQKRSKLDQPVKLLLCSKSYWILLKT